MKILVHDYAGHPFQVQLSRELARRGHDVTHAYANFLQTPRGSLERQADDPETFAVEPIGISKAFEKHNFLRRRFQEVEYGRNAAALIERLRPDWVVSGNTPTEPQANMLRATRRAKGRFASWVQDFYGIAVDRLLRARLPLAGHAVGTIYKRMDAQVLRNSDAIILITDDFRPLLHENAVTDSRAFVVENWAPLDELPIRPKNNAWSRRFGLADKFCFLYSGTLGMKHNPELLAKLAHEFLSDPEVRVVVISEGAGRDWLQGRKVSSGLDNLLLLPFQPFELLPDALGSADVLVAILEPDAGVFSVPSKVLTYLCAGTALLAAMPRENLAARTIGCAGAGIVVAPDADGEFVQAAAELRKSADRRAAMSAAGRAYAERKFDIAGIADSFESIMA